MVRQKIYHRENHAGGTNSALCSAMGEKCLLDGMKSRVVSDSFNRANCRASCVERGHQATVYQDTVQFDRASATLTLSASFLRPSEPRLLAQNIQQSRHRKCFERYGSTVDLALQTNSFGPLRHGRVPTSPRVFLE